MWRIKSSKHPSRYAVGGFVHVEKRGGQMCGGGEIQGKGGEIVTEIRDMDLG